MQKKSWIFSYCKPLVLLVLLMALIAFSAGCVDRNEHTVLDTAPLLTPTPSVMPSADATENVPAASQTALPSDSLPSSSVVTVQPSDSAQPSTGSPSVSESPAAADTSDPQETQTADASPSVQPTATTDPATTPAIDLSITSASGKVGEEVTVYIDAESNTGTCGFDFVIHYDADILALSSIEQHTALKGQMLADSETEPGKIKVAYIADEDYTRTGHLFRIRFTAQTEGTSEIKLSSTAFVANYGDKTVSMQVNATTGTVTIEQNEES